MTSLNPYSDIIYTTKPFHQQNKDIVYSWHELDIYVFISKSEQIHHLKKTIDVFNNRPNEQFNIMCPVTLVNCI